MPTYGNIYVILRTSVSRIFLAILYSFFLLMPNLSLLLLKFQNNSTFSANQNLSHFQKLFSFGSCSSHSWWLLAEHCFLTTVADQFSSSFSVICCTLAVSKSSSHFSYRFLLHHVTSYSLLPLHEALKKRPSKILLETKFLFFSHTFPQYQFYIYRAFCKGAPVNLKT